MKFKTIGNTSQKIPVIGQGTGIGGCLAKTAIYGDKHIRALRLGIDSGMTLIDTAEEYGDGRAEEIVGKAIESIRDKVLVATKFSPKHNSYEHILTSAENSLRRLRTDYIDLYQIHWPNPEIPIAETMRAMKQLLTKGKIRYIGVCNFSVEQFKEAQTFLGSERIVSIQTEYNLFDRSIEKKILPFCEQENITTIAYSPLDQGRIVSSDEKARLLHSIAEKHGKTEAQVSLNWLVNHRCVIAIPNANSEKHIVENSSAVDFELADDDVREINSIFKQECILVSADRLRVWAGNGKNPKIYQTLEDAVANKMGLVPGPLDLAQAIKEGENIKPVRVVQTTDRTGNYDYDLIEGRMRYWAWVIAHNGEKPIPAYVRESTKLEKTAV